jgi:hypothetical protein
MDHPRRYPAIPARRLSLRLSAGAVDWTALEHTFVDRTTSMRRSFWMTPRSRAGTAWTGRPRSLALVHVVDLAAIEPARHGRDDATASRGCRPPRLAAMKAARQGRDDWPASAFTWRRA